MDVARILIRTSCQNVVDEFIDVKINDVVFHLRVLEDSYGPMRIMIPQPRDQDGRNNDSDNSEEEEEEEVGRLLEGVDEAERESEGEGENLLALNTLVNGNNNPLLSLNQVDNLNVANEERKETSIPPFIDNNGGIHHENGVVNEGRGSDVDVDVDKEVSSNVQVENLLGQKIVEGGPNMSNTSHQTVKGGCVRRKYGSENLALSRNSSNQESVRHVYSDGPRHVYNKLVKVQNGASLPSHKLTPRKHSGSMVPFLPSASLRNQHRLVQSLSSRKHKSVSSLSSRPSSNSVEEGVGCGVVNRKEGDGVRPSSISVSVDNSTSSIFSRGDILCCSSINSSDIRNCNKLFLKKHEQEIASKVWQGAVSLGVVENAESGGGSRENVSFGGEENVCIFEIQNNEKRDEEESIRRERKNSVHP
jgi:hypothetical protein